MPRAPRILPPHWPVQDAARYKPLDWFVPYERNARTHPESQVAILAGLLAKFGPDQDIVVDENRVILKGHGRLLAARQAGLACFTYTQRLGLSESDKQAMRLSDNAVSLLSGWDKELVHGAITSLKTQGYDILQLGFPEAQLRGFGIQIGVEGEQDPDAVSAPPPRPIVRVGDLWRLGSHRLICGDCTDAAVVERLLDGKRLDLVFTDPPYNVAYQSNRTDRFGSIDNDNMTDDQFEAWLRTAFEVLAASMRGHACIYVCHPDSASPPKITFERVFAEFFKKSSTIIWVKPAGGMGYQDFRVQHEPILYGWKADGRGRHFCNGDRTRTTVWQISRDSTIAYVHPTQKPVALVEEAVVSSSKSGWNVGDFFAGSGATLIACEQLSRRFFGIELSPAFCESIINRWEKFSESDATLEGDGRTFKEIREDRRRQRPRTRQGSRTHRGGRSDSAGVPRVSQ